MNATPIHHPPTEYLLSYATGGLAEAEALLVASHAALCPACRGRVRELESAAGALLHREAPSAVSNDLLARTMAKLGAQASAPEIGRPAVALNDPILPSPLLRYTGPFAQIRWKWAIPGVRYTVLPLTVNDVPVILRRISGGMRVPMHAHQGPELEMVLAGGASDDRDGRKFERGDVVFNDANDEHSVTIESGEECVALSVHTADIKPIGWWSRLVFALAPKPKL